MAFCSVKDALLECKRRPFAQAEIYVCAYYIFMLIFCASRRHLGMWCDLRPRVMLLVRGWVHVRA